MAPPSKYDPRIHHRRSIRLKGYDYTRPGFYFITLNTHKNKHLFGQIVDGIMILNEFGQLVDFTWNDLPNHNCHVRLDAYVIMPNHFHGIIELKSYDESSSGRGGFKTHSDPDNNNKKMSDAIRHPLSEIIRQFKTFSARRVNTLADLYSLSCSSNLSSLSSISSLSSLSSLSGWVLTEQMSGWVLTEQMSGWVLNPPRQQQQQQQLLKCQQNKNRPLWQRDYYERIIRNSRELERVRNYIRDNPKKYKQR